MTAKKYKKIFVIDDDEIHNFVTQKLLRVFDNEGEIVTYTNSVKAFESLRASAEKDLPEILLLDINMPGLDGFEFLLKMQELNLSDKISVVMYSSSTYNSDKKKARTFSNVIGYMEKPFSPERFGEILEVGLTI